MKNNEQKTIQCNVHECKYCNCKDDKCTLNKIKVSKSSNEENKEDTMCTSFEQEKK